MEQWWWCGLVGGQDRGTTGDETGYSNPRDGAISSNNGRKMALSNVKRCARGWKNDAAIALLFERSIAVEQTQRFVVYRIRVMATS